VKPPVFTSTEPAAYLVGCLAGDAWLSGRSRHHKFGCLGLRVADADFSHAFCRALLAEFDIARAPALDERGYWLVRVYNGFGRFDRLRAFAPHTRAQMAAWLCGFFDSEGNASCSPHPSGPRSWTRNVRMFSTDKERLIRAIAYLDALSIAARLRRTRNSASHKGTLTVWVATLVGSKANFLRFGRLIGSHIARKRDALERMVGTYHPDISQACREARLKGNAIRRARRDAGGKY
jgi:LAGLIDADG-like domain